MKKASPVGIGMTLDEVVDDPPGDFVELVDNELQGSPLLPT